MNLKEAVVAQVDLALNVKSASLLEVPPDSKMGDFALPCFSFAKELGKSPAVIAEEFAAKIPKEKLIASVKTAGPYVNIFLHKGMVAEQVIAEVRSKKEVYGAKCGNGNKVMVEYSQPNSHKAFHVGHIRGTSIGESLSRILRFAGSEVVQANYSGDTGMHVAKWLWCYKKFHDGEEPPMEFGKLGKWLAAVYVEAVQKLQDESLQQEVDALNLALDRKEDAELMALWEKTKQWSVTEFEQIYADLDAHFDVWWWESEVEEEAKVVSKELVEKGIAEVSDDATIINLEEEKLGVWVLLRKDGTPLYSAKDIVLAKKKFAAYDIKESLYVIAAAQSLHMQQLFCVLGKMGVAQASNCHHLSYNEVRLPEGKMSSRTGQNVLYSELREQVFAVAEQGIKERHAEWSEEEVAEATRAVAMAAIKFEMIVRDHNKNIVFDAAQVCDFEGDTGPYIQYMHARCNSILEKLTAVESKELSLLQHDEEYALVKLLEQFPAVVKEAALTYNPSAVAKHTMAVAKQFSTFYHECKVVGSEQESARAALVDATRVVLAQGLSLLGIPAPKKM